MESSQKRFRQVQQGAADMRLICSLTTLENEYEIWDGLREEALKDTDLTAEQIADIKLRRGEYLVEVTKAQEAEVKFYEEIQNMSSSVSPEDGL